MTGHSHGIGDWVMRERLGIAHIAESVVAGDVITHCGRRMTDEPTTSGGELVLAARSALRKCRQCIRTTPQEE